MIFHFIILCEWCIFVREYEPKTTYNVSRVLTISYVNAGHTYLRRTSESVKGWYSRPRRVVGRPTFPTWSCFARLSILITHDTVPSCTFNRSWRDRDVACNDFATRFRKHLPWSFLVYDATEMVFFADSRVLSTGPVSRAVDRQFFRTKLDPIRTQQVSSWRGAERTVVFGFSADQRSEETGVHDLGETREIPTYILNEFAYS